MGTYAGPWTSGVFPAGAGVILRNPNMKWVAVGVSRRRGGDPRCNPVFPKLPHVFPAGAGVILPGQ